MPIPAAAFIASSALSGLAGYLGARQTNRTNQREAQRDRDFQERMRNTQWQAAVEDMRQAGLNPALAYQQGPNAAPGGRGTPQAENQVSSAFQAASARKNLELLTQQVEKTKQEAKSAEATARLDRERSELMLPRVKGSMGGRTIPSLLEETVDIEMANRRLGVEGVRIQNSRNAHLRDITGVGGELARTFGIWGPLLGGLAAPGGVGISSAKGIASALRRRAATRNLQRAMRRRKN